MHKLLASSLFASIALLAAQPVAGVTVGQVDDFEDGTTQGWVVNLLGMGSHPAPPANIADGGPGGAGDNYLRLTAIGGGSAGSRLTALNAVGWAGDYVAADVRFIRMSLINEGNTDLALRLLFEDPTTGPPLNTAFSTDAILLAAGSGWQEVFFPVMAADLTAGVGDVLAALTGTTIVRLYHSSAPGFPGEPIVAQLGVDNIRAAQAIPEPATWAMLIAGFGLIGGALRRRSISVHPERSRGT